MEVIIPPFHYFNSEFPMDDIKIIHLPQSKQSKAALKTKQMQETASVALLLYGLEHFGKTWFEENNPKQFISNEVLTSLKAHKER